MSEKSTTSTWQLKSSTASSFVWSETSASSLSGVMKSSGSVTVTPEACAVLLGVNQKELNEVTRRIAELNRKWDRLQAERQHLLEVQRGPSNR